MGSQRIKSAAAGNDSDSLFRARATCAPTRTAGGDGTGLRIAAARGESAEARRIARCSGTRVWTGDVSLLRERPSFAARRKKAKARPGNHSIKVPRDPSSRPKGPAPLDSLAGGLRGTRDERLFMAKNMIILKLLALPHGRPSFVIILSSSVSFRREYAVNDLPASDKYKARTLPCRSETAQGSALFYKQLFHLCGRQTKRIPGPFICAAL